MGKSMHVNISNTLDREAIMIEFAPIIKWSVAQIQQNSHIPLDREDLIAAALTGLFEAMQEYNPASHDSFYALAHRNIRCSLQQEIRSTAEFFKSITLKPIGPAETSKHDPNLNSGYNWKGHRFNIH
jgi:DNA-directed RNA polymerase specialized sigma subunit